MVYPALLPLMRTPRLPAVYWTDAPADLNGLVLFGERRNLISARVPSRFKRSLPTNYEDGLVPQQVCMWCWKYKLSLCAENKYRYPYSRACSLDTVMRTGEEELVGNYRISPVQWRTQEFFSGGEGCSTNSVEDRGQRGRGSGGGSPLVRGSGGSCNLVQEISFHIVTFS